VHHARCENLEPLLLEVRDDFASLSGAEGVGLDDRELVAGHWFRIL
jgi:hypothetical protein